MPSDEVRALLKDCYYLEDSGITVQGLNIYGTPWMNFYREAGFQKYPQDIEKVWQKIPDNTDILVTHTPPLGFCDREIRGKNVGCGLLSKELLFRVKPMFHLFGHIHEARGWAYDAGSGVSFVNAAIMDVKHKPTNPATLVTVLIDGKKRKVDIESYVPQTVNFLICLDCSKHFFLHEVTTSFTACSPPIRVYIFFIVQIFPCSGVLTYLSRYTSQTPSLIAI
eukprot:TRINITY_DN2747_c0_g2_i4.p1 TRINITY_DN2747_c0_g2~~TRINITY_DN2747_c0_g2_i4.p1  ORF type:complete len:223 (-),score=-11.99 TRINITY_DN2747_c0_g2_i4:25-693(-)